MLLGVLKFDFNEVDFVRKNSAIGEKHRVVMAFLLVLGEYSKLVVGLITMGTYLSCRLKRK